MRVWFITCSLLFTAVSFPLPLRAQDRTEDLSKIAIESPTEDLVSHSRSPAARPRFSPQPAAVADDAPVVTNVKPGNVGWHADLATAQAASRKSGKPVLLFQLLGQLDEHFT